MSPETSGASDKHDDSLDVPSVPSDDVCSPSAELRTERHAVTIGSPQTDLRSYLYRGRHRRPRPVYRTLQAATVLLMFTGASAALAHAQITSQEVRPRSAVELVTKDRASKEPGAPSPQPKTTSDAPKPPEPAAPETTVPPTSADKASEKTSTATTTTKPTWLPVSQSAAQATDQIGTWLNEALGILKANGYSESQMNASQIRAIIQHESGGNPKAINLWDSNAAKGTPSKGLMQTIDPTFNNYSLPGHRNIYNPVDNIIAGVRYSIATYGSISKVPGVLSMAAGGGYRGY